VVTAYKNLKHVERDFLSIKADDLDLRPVWHRLEERVRAHVLICQESWEPVTHSNSGVTKLPGLNVCYQVALTAYVP
jgi:hypothetical protein